MSRKIEVRGLSFDIHLGGPDDGPPALLLHGFPQHSGEWELVAWRLHAAGVRTVAVDQRGYSPGARPAEVEAYRLPEPVADAIAILDALGIDRVHVVGHDWGAIVGWLLAGRHADRVRTLTAVSVPHPQAMAGAIAGDDSDQRERSSYITLFQRKEEAEQRLLADEAARLRAMLAGVPPDRIDSYLGPIRQPGALTAALNWYRAMSPADLAGAVPVASPTTFVWSDQDLAIGRAAARGCGQYVTGDYRFVELSGVSHWIPEEAPAALGDAIVARIGA